MNLPIQFPIHQKKKNLLGNSKEFDPISSDYEGLNREICYKLSSLESKVIRTKLSLMGRTFDSKHTLVHKVYLKIINSMDISKTGAIAS